MGAGAIYFGNPDRYVYLRHSPSSYYVAWGHRNSGGQYVALRERDRRYPDGHGASIPFELATQELIPSELATQELSTFDLLYTTSPEVPCSPILPDDDDDDTSRREPARSRSRSPRR